MRLVEKVLEVLCSVSLVLWVGSWEDIERRVL